MSTGVVSKIFWDIKDLISSDNAKVHFEGVGDL